MVASALRAGKPLLQETDAWENNCNLLIPKLAEMMWKKFHMCLSTMSAGGVRPHHAAWELLAVAQVVPGQTATPDVISGWEWLGTALAVLKP